eukprot:TRINITY_DN14965_c0_g2_i1.p1 TRINITY_DN14965_c0_g2~~TRINITY_DN14965_c0_g2_i1.p1  ORF type:complete len:571 (+),score=51.01 TRINITY_DN14965_c0_g2_i1:111-1823(+)
MTQAKEADVEIGNSPGTDGIQSNGFVVHASQIELSQRPEPKVIGHSSSSVANEESDSRPLKAHQVDPADEKPHRISVCSWEMFWCVARFIFIVSLVLAMAVAFFDFKAVEDNITWRSRLLTGIFILSLFAVALEDMMELNKTWIMLCSAGIMWTIIAVSDHPNESTEGNNKLFEQVSDGLEEVGRLILFLLPAMGLCESIDHFNGFAVLAQVIRWSVAGKQGRMVPIICLMTYLLCIVVDSMSATIVALKILKCLSPYDAAWRRRCGAVVVLGANACVWSPIGEVTTAMLWIGGKITPSGIMSSLVAPSLASVLVPVCGIWWKAIQAEKKGDVSYIHTRSREVNGVSETEDDEDGVTRSSVGVLCLGIFCILTVPVLKIHTGLPPYFGMLFALGTMWAVTDKLGIKGKGDRDSDGHTATGVMAALHNVDLAGLLFFAGVLQSVAALNSAKILRSYALTLAKTFGDSPLVISVLLGLASSLVDNVPLVQAAIDMFHNPVDDTLWHLVALTAGLGGSLLATGGIAGVTLMNMEGVSFLWFARNVSGWALLGFTSGVVTYELQQIVPAIFHQR